MERNASGWNATRGGWRMLLRQMIVGGQVLASHVTMRHSDCRSWKITLYLSDWLIALYRNRKAGIRSDRLHSHDLAFTGKFDRMNNWSTLQGHKEAHGTVLRNRGCGFQKHPADADVSAHRVEFRNRTASGELYVYRVLKIKTTISAFMRAGVVNTLAGCGHNLCSV